jgi:EAL domain-containing protein (putative c-di-GMP-specific phosphodiesterase class I)
MVSRSFAGIILLDDLRGPAVSNRNRKNGLADYLPAIVEHSAVAGDLNRALKAIRSHLGMDVAFVSEFTEGRRIFRHVDSLEGLSPIQVGDSSPLEEGYCQRVVDGRLPELIPDTAALADAMALPETQAVPIGAHLSVPIRLASGQVYGTFCCFSFAADASLNERDLQMMRVFADLTAFQIDRELVTAVDRKNRLAFINKTIDQQLFSIVYQPIYELGHGRVAGLECLARFSAVPLRSPDEWFLEAADVDMGVELEIAAMRMALTALPLIPADVYLAVNLSPPTIINGDVAVMLKGIPLDRIVLEVTEHESIPAYSELSQSLDPLRRAGLRVAVDDAGAGYASMRHILNLKPNLIKLDMSLTRDIDSDLARQALALALIGFARDTDCQIIAEGVETAGELATLRLLGVTKAQGYLLGRPMPLTSASHLFSKSDTRHAALSNGM